MKDVLVLNQFALPRSEGGGTRHIDLFSRLDGWSAVIVAGDKNHYSQNTFTTSDPRFHLIPVPSQGGGPVARLAGWVIFGLRAFVMTLRRDKLDLVYGSSPQPFAALAGLWAARLRKVPFVLEVRDLWPESIVAAGRLVPGSVVHRIFCWIERHLSLHAAQIVCVTDGWQDHFVDLGVDPQVMVVIPNGTEPSEFVVDTPRLQLRTWAAVEGFTAVFAGAHGPKDGIDLVLDAARQLPHIHFLLVGSGPSKSALLRRAKREGIDNVEFRDPVSKADLPRLLRACDVGVHSVTPLSVFRHGMSPNKLFDYMAAQLPIVSNARTALSRIIHDGECGRVGTSDELADCLQAVYDSTPEQREEWGRRALQIVSERYDRASAARRLEHTLDLAQASYGQRSTRP